MLVYYWSWYMGIVSVEAREGDVICTLLGAQVPFVLRPNGICYNLVGECYIHGIMKGEATKFPYFNAQEVTLV